MYYRPTLTASEGFRLIKSQIQNGQVGFEEQEISSIDLNKKSIVVLCGNNTKHPIRAASYTNYIFNWLNEYEDKENVTAYSVFYPSEQPLLLTLQQNPCLRYAELARIMFKNLLEKDGKTESVESISKKFGNITFFGHSAGGFVMNELMFELGSMLKERGLSDEDINKVYSSIVFVGYSPFALVDAPVNSVYIAPVYDTVGSTKLVYEKMIQNENIISSNPKLDIAKICKFRASSYSSFFKLYETAIQDEDSLYFVDGKSLISTPNLLFFDGLKEDHNLAGIIDYPEEHPHKTKAGKHTTDFMHTVFNYCLSTERKKFSTIDLFNQVAPKTEKPSEQDNKNKEL